MSAAQVYEQLKPTKEILQNLGDCYYYNFQMDNAVKAYGQLFFFPSKIVLKRGLF